MPAIYDYSDDEDDSGGGSGGGSGARRGAATGVSMTEPSKQDEAGFVPWERFVTANKDVSQREAGKLASGVEGQAKGVQSELDAASKQQEKDVAANYAQPAKPAGPAFGSIASAPTAQASFGTRGPSSAVSALVQQREAAKTAPPPRTQNPDSKYSNAQQPAPQDNSSKYQNAAPAPVQDTSSKYKDQKPFTPPPEAAAPRTVDPDRLTTNVTGNTWKTTADGLTGAKSLEEQFNKGSPTGWEDFLGRAVNANEAATALGDESGVSALLEQQTPTPNSAFDAALLTGAGGDRFRELADQYGGGKLGEGITAASKGAQDRWSQLFADANAAAGARDEDIANANREKDRIWDEQQRAEAEANRASEMPEERGPWAPEGYTDFKSFIDAPIDDVMDAGAYAHEGAMYASPADWLTRALGEAGYNGENASQLFSKAFGADGNKNGTWQTGNLRAAVRTLQDEYGPEALEFWWNSMTPEMWQAYQDLGNAGAMSREIRAWLESAGYRKKGQPVDNFEGGGTGTVVVNNG